MEERVDWLETEQWAQKRTLEQLDKPNRWIVVGSKAMHALWEELVKGKAGKEAGEGWQKFKEQMGRPLVTELKTQFNIFGEDTQMEQDKKDLKTCLDGPVLGALSRGNVANVYAQIRFDQGTRAQVIIEGTIKVRLTAGGNGPNDLTQAYRDHLDVALRALTGSKTLIFPEKTTEENERARAAKHRRSGEAGADTAGGSKGKDNKGKGKSKDGKGKGKGKNSKDKSGV